MNQTIPAYGLWSLVFINSAIFIFFAFSFIKPKTKLDWRSLGAFSAFIVAMFAEMYGFPLTIYLLSGWLQNHYPAIDLLAHDNGHLWYSLFGLEGNPHTNPLHLISNILIMLGFVLVYQAWRILYKAQQHHKLAVSGPYHYIRHPQYAGLLLIMFGFLLMWPTLLTLVMFPVLVLVYLRLAHQEELQIQAEFGETYTKYAANTPPLLPHLG